MSYCPKFSLPVSKGGSFRRTCEKKNEVVVFTLFSFTCFDYSCIIIQQPYFFSHVGRNESLFDTLLSEDIMNLIEQIFFNILKLAQYISISYMQAVH